MSKAETADVQQVLDFVFYDEDIGQDITVRKYLKLLLSTLWEEREGFSGKRPFGNSSWPSGMEEDLVSAGLIDGTLDGAGYVETGDDGFDDLIKRCIEALH